MDKWSEFQRRLDASVTPEQAAEYVRKERERNANRDKPAPPGEQKPVALAHVRLEDDGLFADLQVLDGTNLQPSMSPIALYTSPPPAAGWNEAINWLEGIARNDGNADQLAAQRCVAILRAGQDYRREAPAPEGMVLTGIDVAAEYLVRTVKRANWDGIRKDGRARDAGLEPFLHNNARQDDYRDVVREIVRLAVPSRPDAGGVREALEDAEDSFEFIRQKLINNLEEPERSAFWRAVDARERCRAALSTRPVAVESFQSRVQPWMMACGRPSHLAGTNIGPTDYYGYAHDPADERRHPSRPESDWKQDQAETTRIKPSDPTTERREIVARTLRSLKEITPKDFANYHNLIDEALSGLAALDGGAGE